MPPSGRCCITSSFHEHHLQMLQIGGVSLVLSLTCRYFSWYTLYNINQVPENFPSPKKEVTGVIISIVRDLLVVVRGFSTPSISCNDSGQTSVKQRHQYVFLI